MATSNSDTLDSDVKKMNKSNFISYLVNLRGLYKDKPKQEAPAAEPTKKRTKPIMGGANPEMDDEVRREM